MSAFPFARDMKVCDSKGAIQTTLLVDNYIVSAGLPVGLTPAAQGSWELLCTFFPAEFLTSWQRIAEMVPLCLRSPVPFVWAMVQSTFVWDCSAACGENVTSRGLRPYPAKPLAVLCAPWLCKREDERRGEWEWRWVEQEWVSGPSLAACCWEVLVLHPLLLPLSLRSCHSLTLVLLQRCWAGLAFWSHRRLTRQKRSRSLGLLMWTDLQQGEVSTWSSSQVRRERGARTGRSGRRDSGDSVSPLMGVTSCCAVACNFTALSSCI